MANDHLFAVSGRRRRRGGQTAALNARLPLLGEIMRQRESRRQHKENLAFREKEFAAQRRMQRKRFRAEEAASEKQLGLEAAKFGIGQTFGEFGRSTIGEAFGGLFGGERSNIASANIAQDPSLVARGRSIAGLSPQTTPTIGTTVPGRGKDSTSLFGKAKSAVGGLTVGSTLGAGATGFGVGRMFGKKRKLLGAGLGALAGGLMGAMGGGGFSGFGTGAAFGGLGALGGSLF